MQHRIFYNGRFHASCLPAPGPGETPVNFFNLQNNRTLGFKGKSDLVAKFFNPSGRLFVSFAGGFNADSALQLITFRSFPVCYGYLWIRFHVGQGLVEKLI